ncbi:MAG: hypothetical protein PVG07_12380 [Acidobacteriota bacterium]|jgi:hypothetical protein
MKKRLVRTLVLATVLAAGAALAVASIPQPLEAQQCTPIKEIWIQHAATWGCCSSDPPGRTHLHQKYVRYQTPNCSWTDWQFEESFTVCISDASCGWVQA